MSTFSRGVPPFNETRHYVRKIIGLYGGVRHAFDGSLAEAPGWLETTFR